MTVGELRNWLRDFDPDMEVRIGMYQGRGRIHRGRNRLLPRLRGGVMKYTVTAIIAEDDEVSVEVSVRQGAKTDTVFRKCMNEIGRKLIELGILKEGAKFKYDKPNIWRNGGVGAAWFCSPLVDVTIQEENGAWFAL